VGQFKPSAGVLTGLTGSIEGEGVAIGEAEGSGVEDCCGAACLIATPLFQSNFLPLFTQVYFFPPTVFVVPTFEHLVPAIEAASMGENE
jgi:hypothetical protein